MSDLQEKRDDDTLVVSVYKTYYTEESIEHGESDRSEEVYINESFEFDELVRYIQDNGFYHRSDDPGTPRWIMTNTEIEDFGTGEKAELSLHPANDEQTQSLWEQALISAGFTLRHAPKPQRMTP